MPSNRTLVAGLAWGAVLAGCGGLADGHYQGEPLAVIQGTLTQAGPVEIAGEMSFALLWAPAASHESALNLLGGATVGPAPGGSYVETCADTVSRTLPLCDGTAAAGNRSCDWTDRRVGSLLRVVDFQPRLPPGFEIPVRDLPPTAALYDLSRQGGFGSFALASVVAFDDVNRDGAFRTGTPADPPEPTLVDSGHQSYLPGPNQPRRSYLLAYLDGLIDPGRIDPALAEVLLFLPQGFSVWVEDQWLDEYGRVQASGRLWQPVDAPIDLFWPTQAVVGCEKGTRRTVYRPDIPAGEAPAWCSDDHFRATWSRTTASGCVAVEERYSGDFSCAGPLPPAWSCPGPATGSLLVSVTTAGENLDPDGYVLSVDGAPQAIGTSASLTLSGMSPGTHTVTVGGVAENCAVAGGSTVQVAVIAGSTAFLGFKVDCWRPGSMVVGVYIGGQSLDRDGVAVSVDDSPPRTIDTGSYPSSAYGRTTFSGLPAGIHRVALSGLASNCTAPQNPLEVEVGPNATAYPLFMVVCFLKVGDVRVTTTTSGPEPDQDGYTLTLSVMDEGGGYSSTQPIAASGTALFQGVPLGDSWVSISGLARNCWAPISTLYVPVVDGQTVDLAFAIECVAAGSSIAVTTTTSGTDLDPDGYFVTWSGPSPTETVAVPANGVTAIAGLVPGDYQLSVSGVAPNCQGTRSATAPVVAGAATPVAVDVTCAPDRGLAFVSYDDGNPEIYFIRSSGTGATRLTVNPANDFDPAWSPDGARLAFTSDRDGNAEIYVMDADGSNVRRLTNEPARDYSPAWSPDGTRIAFVSERDGSAEIYVMNADGSSPARLTHGPAPSSFPDWSPDGARIAFARGGLIWVMNADGAGASALTTRATNPIYSFYSVDGQPDWSPDGTKIAFSRSPAWDFSLSPVPYFWVINADGTGERYGPQGNFCTDYSDPGWSPDGRHLVVTATLYGGDGYCWLPTGNLIRIVAVDGADPIDIARGTQPAWRP